MIGNMIHIMYFIRLSEKVRRSDERKTQTMKEWGFGKNEISLCKG